MFNFPSPVKLQIPNNSAIVLCAVALSLLGLILRLWNISFDLPYITTPDEVHWARKALHMLKSGDLNPRYLVHPSLYFYANFFAIGLWYLVECLLGRFESVSDIQDPFYFTIGVGFAPQPEVILVMRTLTAVVSSLTIPFAMMVCLRGGMRAIEAFTVALAVALSPIGIRHARLVSGDAYVEVFFLVALLFALRANQTGHLKHYMLTGIAAGLATSAKYNGMAAAVLLAALPLVRGKMAEYWHVVKAISAAACVFFLTTPLAVIEPWRFIHDLQSGFNCYTRASEDHVFSIVPTLHLYLAILVRDEGLLPALGFASLFVALFDKNRFFVLSAIMAVSYLIFISSFRIARDYVLLPIVPVFSILGIYGMSKLVASATLLFGRTAIAWGVAVLAVLIYFPLTRVIDETQRLIAPDNFGDARLWVDRNLPASSSIVLEQYTILPDPTRFKLKGVVEANNYSADFFRMLKADYLILSSAAFNDYAHDLNMYLAEIRATSNLEKEFELVAEFREKDGPQITVMRIR